MTTTDGRISSKPNRRGEGSRRLPRTAPRPAAAGIATGPRPACTNFTSLDRVLNGLVGPRRHRLGILTLDHDLVHHLRPNPSGQHLSRVAVGTEPLAPEHSRGEDALACANVIDEGFDPRRIPVCGGVCDRDFDGNIAPDAVLRVLQR